MANKPQPMIIELTDFRVYLMAHMRIQGLSAQEMAEKLGISVAAVYNLLSGTDAPSDEVLEKVGLRKVYVLAGDGDAAMAKRPAKKK